MPFLLQGREEIVEGREGPESKGEGELDRASFRWWENEEPSLGKKVQQGQNSKATLRGVWGSKKGDGSRKRGTGRKGGGVKIFYVGVRERWILGRERPRRGSIQRKS